MLLAMVLSRDEYHVVVLNVWNLGSLNFPLCIAKNKYKGVNKLVCFKLLTES